MQIFGRFSTLRITLLPIVDHLERVRFFVSCVWSLLDAGYLFFGKLAQRFFQHSLTALVMHFQVEISRHAFSEISPDPSQSTSSILRRLLQ